MADKITVAYSVTFNITRTTTTTPEKDRYGNSNNAYPTSESDQVLSSSFMSDSVEAIGNKVAHILSAVSEDE